MRWILPCDCSSRRKTTLWAPCLGQLVWSSCSVNVLWCLKSKKKTREGRRESFSPYTGQVIYELRSPSSRKSASTPAKRAWEEITLFFLTILCYAWNKSNCQFNLICMLCGGSGSGHQEDSASPWQSGDLQMGAWPSFHCSSSWIWT